MLRVTAACRTRSRKKHIDNIALACRLIGARLLEGAPDLADLVPASSVSSLLTVEPNSGRCGSELQENSLMSCLWSWFKQCRRARDRSAQPVSPSARPLLRVRWASGNKPGCIGVKRVESSVRSEQTRTKHAERKWLNPDLHFQLNGTHYRLHTPLGRGAHCVVWRCHLSPGTEVDDSSSTDLRPRLLALKVHTSHCDGSRQARREADALRALAIT